MAKWEGVLVLKLARLLEVVVRAGTPGLAGRRLCAPLRSFAHEYRRPEADIKCADSWP